ncbi:MAG: ABC transporter ATP-binding protein [Oscillospiraceae bacterium]|nr:ABC transporter ATP-binding protein [Oscillospiraceae bacterium]
MIKVENLCKHYPGGDRAVCALDHVSFHISKGEFVAIVGKSGSGKSTLMNILGCLDAPSAGSYYLDGACVSDLCVSKLCSVRSRKIGFVFQGFHLVPRLTALENVMLPLRFAGVSREEQVRRANEALFAVGLSHRLRHRPAQMSGGQQQRVAIARAIVMNPPLILADEPTGNLDPTSGREILRLLKEQHSRGATVLVITHDMEIAAHAERVLEIENGTIHQMG